MSCIRLSIILLFISIAAYSAKPIIDLPEQPSKSELETYSDNQSMYLVQLIKYYRIASIYQQQLNMLNVVPATQVEMPTIDELENADAKTLKKYYGRAKALKSEIEKAKYSINSDYEKLYSNLKEAYSQIDSLAIENLKLNTAIAKENNKQLNIEKLISEITKLQSVQDSLTLQHYKEMNSLRKKMMNIVSEKYKNSYSLLSAYLGATKIFTGTDNISINLYPIAGVSFNLGHLMGIGNIIEIWGEYNPSQLRITETQNLTVYPNNTISISTDWTTQIFSIGLNANLREAFKIGKVAGNFALGFGMISGTARANNLVYDAVNINGGLLRLEFSLTSTNKIYPMELFINYNNYFINDNLSFHISQSNFRIDSPNFKAVNFGARVSLWKETN